MFYFTEGYDMLLHSFIMFIQCNIQSLKVFESQFKDQKEKGQEEKMAIKTDSNKGDIFI